MTCLIFLLFYVKLKVWIGKNPKTDTKSYDLVTMVKPTVAKENFPNFDQIMPNHWVEMVWLSLKCTNIVNICPQTFYSLKKKLYSFVARVKWPVARENFKIFAKILPIFKLTLLDLANYIHGSVFTFWKTKGSAFWWYMTLKILRTPFLGNGIRKV